MASKKSKAKKQSAAELDKWRKENGYPPPGAFSNDSKPGKFFMYDEDSGETHEVDADGERV